MRAIMKNDWHRTWRNKGRLLVMFLLMIVTTGVALYMSNHQTETLRIGFVGEKSELSLPSKGITLTYLDTMPPTSELVKGTYDAVVQKKGRHLIVKTLKNDAYKTKVTEFFSTPNQIESISSTKRGTGSLIIGYLLMFLLMTSMTNIFTFNEDKEKHLLERIITTPISLLKILLAHSLFSFFLLFIPTLLIVSSAKLIFGLSIGFSLLDYFLLLGMICFFATGLSLFFAALFNDSDRSNMVGSSVVVITTLLSGSFFSFENGNKWLHLFIQLLPQKRYLEIVNHFEKGRLFSTILPNILYLALFTATLFLLALLKTRKEYIRI